MPTTHTLPSPLLWAIPCSRLTRGGSDCRVLTISEKLIETGEAHAPISAEQAPAALSAVIDRVVATGIAA